MIRKLDAKGVTLVELLIASAILAMVALAVMSSRYFLAKRTGVMDDKAYAAEKAMQMMEEIKSIGAQSTAILDNYADGSNSYNPLLTTDPSVTNPGDPLSGNRTTPSGGWRFLRNISIQHMSNSTTGRLVYIRVFRSSDSNPTLPDTDLADVSGIVDSNNQPTYPTQVFDVYILDLANVPGWWAQVPTLKNTFENQVIPAITNLNKGLAIRQHYITRTAFGRDAQYIPYINNAKTTEAAPMPYVYFYPGTVTDDNGSPNTFYGVASGNATILGVDQIGTVNIDGSISNSTPYPICDQYNHAVRYPDEVRLYNQAVAQAQASGNPVPEPSLRMLLEEMNSEPQSFTNALLVNLHGELLPMPAMRNYSDPAKDPANNPYVRVVTHPEQIHYGTSNNVNLRVYAYYDGFQDATNLSSLSATAAVSQITLLFPPASGATTITAANIAGVTAIIGNGSVTYAEVPLTQGAVSMGMSWSAGQTTIAGLSQLCVTLSGTPLRCVLGPGGGGLSSTNWLYGLEYIPCPIKGKGQPFNAFDLSYKGSPNIKNTARWVITLSGLKDNTDTNDPYIFETRIGPDLNSGSITDNPPNLSRTYTWLGSSVPPPLTECYQFIGDPRHCPYMDVKDGGDTVTGPNGNSVTIGPDGYNWYFTSVPSGTSGYNGFGQSANGWGSQLNRIDVPRYFQIFRNALLKTQAIWSTMNGYSYFYYGLGGEFGGDTPPFQNGVSLMAGPWVPGSTAVTTVDEILTQNWASAKIKNSHIIMNTADNWYAKYWLGELYPDSQYARWATIGNLPTGTNNFYRENYNSPNLTAAGWSGPATFQGTSLDSMGCASFLNGNATGSGSSYFGHDGSLNNPPPYPASYSATIMQLGVNLQPIFTIPLASPMLCTRPWYIGLTGTPPVEWTGTGVYTSQMTTLTVPSITTGGVAVPRNFYQSEDTNNSKTWNGSAAIEQTQGNLDAYYVISGLAIQANVGTQELGEIALMEMLRTYMDGGLYAAPSHIVQLPLVTLLHPVPTDTLANPTSISVTWTSAWQRWGANPYTEEYAPISYTADNSVTINYNLKYNQQGSWYFVGTNAPATLGVYDPSQAITATSYNWDVSDTSRFTQGDYDLMVEAYRENYPIHYSYHEQDDLFISR